MSDNTDSTYPTDDQINVMVVEDDVDVRFIVGRILKKNGYCVTECDNGRVAMNKLSDNSKIDLVVTDVDLAGAMTGHDLAVAVEQLRPGIPVLFITGSRNRETVGELVLQPYWDVLHKPFRLDSFASKVRAMLSLCMASRARNVTEVQIAQACHDHS